MCIRDRGGRLRRRPRRARGRRARGLRPQGPAPPEPGEVGVEVLRRHALEPVSYTHLDVYKRQLPRRVRPQLLLGEPPARRLDGRPARHRGQGLSLIHI